MPNEDVLAFNQIHFAMASLVEWDKQWRMLLPDKTLKRTGIGREVTLIGARDHLELWNRADWERRFEELFGRSEAIMLKAQLALQRERASQGERAQQHDEHGG
jgi:DNA-binding transcriptional regulator/RsmH inhibitor MraZ